MTSAGPPAPNNDDRIGRWERILPQFSLRRRVTVLVLMMTAVVVGIISTTRIPIELVPRGYDVPQLSVTANWRDAPPKEVLDKIILPLEDNLAQVSGLDQLNSISRTGRGRLFLIFKHNTNMDVAYREVRDAILRAQPALPSDVDTPRILKQSEASVPIMVVGVAINEAVTDPYNLIQNRIIRPLSRIDGVASVRANGLQEKEVLIELDREKTEAAGLNIYLVGQELATDNFSMPSGDVRNNGKKLLLRSLARFTSLDQLRNRFVSPTTRLQDIGTVRFAEPERTWRVRVNSKPAHAVQIFKEGDANTIDVSDRLLAAFQDVQRDPKLAGSDTAVLFAQGSVIKESISTLVDNGQVGALLAALVLFIFLRRVRLTLIIALSIPLSLLIALTAMYFAGETLNILSLLALIISVGLLVDNSVVVAENIVRHYNSGLSRRDASIVGASEIALAIVLATLTTIVVFLPVSLVEGKGQFFLLRLAIPITASLAASLFVALIFVPLCVYLTLGRRATSTRWRRHLDQLRQAIGRVLETLYRHTLGRLSSVYSAGLGFFVRRRLELVFALIVAFTLSLLGPATHIELVDVTEDDRKDFNIRVQLPSTFTLDDASAFFGEVEAQLETIRGELDLDGYFVFHASVFGSVQGWFSQNRSLTRKTATSYILERLPKRPGVKYFSGGQDRGAKVEDNQDTYSLVLTAEAPEQLEGVTDRLEDLFRNVDGVLGIQHTMDMTPNEVALVVDRERAANQGINPTFIAGVVAYGLRGQNLPRFNRDGREVPMRLRFRREDSSSLTELQNYAVPTASGAFVRLSGVTRTEHLRSSRGIFRQSKRISRRVTVELDNSNVDATRKHLDGITAALDLPEGVRFSDGPSKDLLEDEKASLELALLVSVVFIYLLMGFLFESFLLPLSILCTIPAALIGVWWALYIAGRDLDFLGFVGLILLFGVVVNNGIVIIDYVNRLRKQGLSRTDAVVTASRQRFRPIMMTALTTIFGMVPLTFGEPTSIGISYRSFGLTLIGGMLAATALTLLVVPVFYTLIEDARNAVMGAFLGRRIDVDSRQQPDK